MLRLQHLKTRFGKCAIERVNLPYKTSFYIFKPFFVALILEASLSYVIKRCSMPLLLDMLFLELKQRKALRHLLTSLAVQFFNYIVRSNNQTANLNINLSAGTRYRSIITACVTEWWCLPGSPKAQRATGLQCSASHMLLTVRVMVSTWPDYISRSENLIQFYKCHQVSPTTPPLRFRSQLSFFCSIVVVPALSLQQCRTKSKRRRAPRSASSRRL